MQAFDVIELSEEKSREKRPARQCSGRCGDLQLDHACGRDRDILGQPSV